MKRFFTQLLQVDGRPVKHPINQYESADVKTMADAASHEAIAETSKSGGTALVASPFGTEAA